MYELNVTRKTGFIVTDPSVAIIIRDNRGTLFYSTEPLVPKTKRFNMPALGKFIVDSGKFRIANEPVFYPLVRMPKRTAYRESPINFSIKFGENKNKASINFLTREIEFDHSVAELPLPYIYYLYYHEIAHQFFGTNKPINSPEYNMCEKWCDVMSSNYMLNKGFNPSQIKEAQRNTLSQRNEFRKDFLQQKLETSTGLNS